MDEYQELEHEEQQTVAELKEEEIEAQKIME